MTNTPTTPKSDVKVTSAWVVTWEGTTDLPDDPVAVLNYRMSPSSVQDFVELLYASLSYSPREKLLFAKNRKANPYPPKMNVFQRIDCGDNPFLHARRVSDLKMVDDRLTWTEPPSDPERRAKLSRYQLLRLSAILGFTLPVGSAKRG